MGKSLRNCDSGAESGRNLDDRKVFSGKELILIDFGSGTTKLKKLGFDIEIGKWKIIGSHTVAIPHQQCLEESAIAKQLSEECINSGIDKVEKALGVLNASCATMHCLGVATAWARYSENLFNYFEPMETKIGIKLRVLTQDEEAELGYVAAIRFLLDKDSCIDTERLLIYDIGGGSWQLSLKKSNSNEENKNSDQIINDSLLDLKIYQGPFGSVNFAHKLRDHLNISHVEPRLLRPEEIKKAELFAKEVIGSNLASSDISEYARSGNYTVYAIGDFMNKGFGSFTTETKTLSKDLLLMMKKVWMNSEIDFLKLLFPLIPEEYVIEMQTNMIIVNEIMASLGIVSIQLLPDVSIAGAVNYLPKLFFDADLAS